MPRELLNIPQPGSRPRPPKKYVDTEAYFDPATWDTYRAMVPRGEEPTSTEARNLRAHIIVHFLYLTTRVVSKMKKTMPTHVERDDLESWAKIGLMQAVARYNHTLGVPFEAFATQRMRSVIMDGIRDSDWAPRSLRKKQRDIAMVEDAVVKTQSRSATEDEVATALGVSVDEVRETKRKADAASHTYIEGSLEAQNKPSTLDADEDELVTILKVELARAVSNMPIRKAAVIALHYFEEKNLADIARLLRTSEVKIGAVHSEAVMDIWARLEAASLENV